LLPVHFVNLCDVLPSECKLYSAGGTPIEFLGHCQITIQLENGFLVETDYIISPSIKEPMLGIDWLTRNAARWIFLEGTIIIQNPAFNSGRPSSSYADLGRDLTVKSVRRDDYAKLTTSQVVFPSMSSPISNGNIISCY